MWPNPGSILRCYQETILVTTILAVTGSRMPSVVCVIPCYHSIPPPDEDMVHLLTRCRGTLETRSRIIPELLNTIQQHFPTNSILVHQNHSHLAQLILDPTSLNLPINMRISPDHPALSPALAVCRKLCFAIHKDRTNQLKKLRTK